MVIDTSAIIAIFLEEPERDEFLAKIDTVIPCYVSACTVVEASVVLRSKGQEQAVRAIEVFLDTFEIEIVPFDDDQAWIAVEADREYGKGRQNRAKLNLGDLYSYALAKHLDESLLFKGDDFIWTDIRRA